MDRDVYFEDYFDDDICDLVDFDEPSPTRANHSDLSIAINPVRVGRGSSEKTRPNPDGEGTPTPGNPNRQDKNAHRSRIMSRQAHLETRRLNPAYRQLVDAVQSDYSDRADQILEDLRLYPRQTNLGIAAKLRLMRRELESRPPETRRNKYLGVLAEASQRYCTMKGFVPDWGNEIERHNYIEVVRAVKWVESRLVENPVKQPLSFTFEDLPSLESCKL